MLDSAKVKNQPTNSSVVDHHKPKMMHKPTTVMNRDESS
jgi:hypothetical protein